MLQQTDDDNQSIQLLVFPDGNTSGAGECGDYLYIKSYQELDGSIWYACFNGELIVRINSRHVERVIYFGNEDV